MVLSAARRWVSRSPTPTCANGSISMPTPKSKPSRMKKPRNIAAMTPNHNSWSSTGQLLSGSVCERERRDLVVAGWARRRRFGVVFQRSFDDVSLEQPEPDQREHRVNQGERRQGYYDHAGILLG